MKFTRIVICFLLWGLICPGLVYGQEQPKKQVIVDQKRIKDEVTKKWDKSSETYDTYYGKVSKILYEEETKAWREVLGRLIPGKELKILDVGCGTGYMSFILAGMGQEVYGIDLSKKMLAKSEEKAKAKAESGESCHVHFQLGDAENPPFANGFFDVVITRHVVWTLPSPQKAVDSWTRVLKENGKIIVIDAMWDDGSLETRLRKKISEWLIYLVDKKDTSQNFYSPALQAALPHAKGLSAEKAKAYLERAGLQEIQILRLKHITDIRRKYIPFRHRIRYNYDYYAVCGQKQSQR